MSLLLLLLSGLDPDFSISTASITQSTWINRHNERCVTARGRGGKRENVINIMSETVTCSQDKLRRQWIHLTNPTAEILLLDAGV